MRIKIRECKKTDLLAVVGLLNELKGCTLSTQEIDKKNVEKIFNEMIESPKVYNNFIAEANGIIVGFLSLIFYKTMFHNVGTALINELVVKSDYRGRGVGKLLIEKAIDVSKNNKMDELEVGVEKQNIKAKEFYKKCGLTEEYILLGIEFK